MAETFDFVARAAEFAAGDPQPAVLLVVGADDDPAFGQQAHRLREQLGRRYRDPDCVDVATIPGMAHAFADEPGIDPSPPTPQAHLVDAAVTDWFARHLR